MKFVTIRDFRNKAPEIRRDLQTDREIILTANGRPFAMVTPVSPDTLEQEVVEHRRGRFRLLVQAIRAQAKAAGKDKMTMEEIDEIIEKARAERRAGK